VEPLALRTDYRKPVPIEQAVELRAREIEFSGRKSIVKCSASSRGVLCAEVEVVAVLVAAAPAEAVQTRRKERSMR
jgi:acyl-CoA thioesterase FadM